MGGKPHSVKENAGRHARPPTLEVRSTDLAVLFTVSRLRVARDPRLKGRERREREWRWAGEREGKRKGWEKKKEAEKRRQREAGGEMWLRGRTLALHARGPEFESQHLGEKKGKKNSSHFCHVTFFQVFQLVHGIDLSFGGFHHHNPGCLTIVVSMGKDSRGLRCFDSGSPAGGAILRQCIALKGLEPRG